MDLIIAMLMMGFPLLVYLVFALPALKNTLRMETPWRTTGYYWKRRLLRNWSKAGRACWIVAVGPVSLTK